MKENKFTYIAELCQNHLGNYDNVKRMVEECAFNGANIIKLQYIYADNLVFRPEFEIGVKLNGVQKIIKRPYFKEKKRLKKLELKNKEFEKFVKICKEFEVEPAITCFAREHVNELYDLGFETVKIASYDCSSFQLIREIGKKFKKVIISTGATYDSEISKTSRILKSKNRNFSFLHCVTIYPTPLNQLNLKRINYLRKFTKNCGFSDHTISKGKLKNFASKAAIYFGANLVERHIRIFDRNMSKDGPVSIMPFDISDVIEFSKLSKSDQSLNLKENYNYQISKTFGRSQRKLSKIELLNRYYYRGRFGSFDRKNYRHLFNWEEIEI